MMENSREAELSELRMRLLLTSGKKMMKKIDALMPIRKDEAVEAAKKLGGPVWVVKAQIHAGGRGKGGGVKVAKSLDEVKTYATQILGMQLKTHQTGPEGQKVRRLLVEDGADIKKEPGIHLAIIGKPNAGKSTLLNTLMKKTLAKVENKPGTTRDYIAGRFTLQKKKYIVYDTAGIRKK